MTFFFTPRSREFDRADDCVGVDDVCFLSFAIESISKCSDRSLSLQPPILQTCILVLVGMSEPDYPSRARGNTDAHDSRWVTAAGYAQTASALPHCIAYRLNLLISATKSPRLIVNMFRLNELVVAEGSLCHSFVKTFVHSTK